MQPLKVTYHDPATWLRPKIKNQPRQVLQNIRDWNLLKWREPISAAAGPAPLA